MAESLQKIYERYKMAESVAVYQKADASMKLPTKDEYDALPPDIKAQYPQFDDYVSAQRNQHNMVKNAIKAKISALRGVLATKTEFTADEKAQYDAELSTFANTITPLNGNGNQKVRSK